jgi:N-acyl-D-amino-acid deacylase
MNRLVIASHCVLVVTLSVMTIPCSSAAQVESGGTQHDLFDVLIRNGNIYDGSGTAPLVADVGIRDGRIAAMGDLSAASAPHIIDADGKAVVPGFIDIHSHADRGLASDNARRSAAPNLVSQGITTVVVNQDGRSPWPIADQRTQFKTMGIGPNAILMVGHGEVRRRVMADDFRRTARPDEIDQMRGLVRQAVSEGAWGISAGLEYVPGRWSTTEEVTALVAEIAPDGVYISHERSEGSDPMWFWPSQDELGAPTLLDAVRETIEIGERTGATVVASHIKAKGVGYWGTSEAAVQLIRSARERGVRIWADQYPYNTTGSDGNTVLIPRWAFEGVNSDSGDYGAALETALDEPGGAAEIRRDIAHEIARRGGADNIVVFDYPDSTFIGASVAELSERRGATPVDMAMVMQFEGFRDRPGGARLRGFSLSETDIEVYAPNPWVATASDAGVALPGDPPVHARFYGTFPRKIRHYAMNRGLLNVAEAIRSSTSVPATIMGLSDRGWIREGLVADIAILDLEHLQDRATFFEPHQYAAGIDYVFVRGEAVVAAGELTGALPGRVLGRP